MEVFIVILWAGTMVCNAVLGFMIYSGLKNIEHTIVRINSPAHDAPESTQERPNQ